MNKAMTEHHPSATMKMLVSKADLRLLCELAKNKDRCCAPEVPLHKPLYTNPYTNLLQKPLAETLQKPLAETLAERSTVGI